MNTDIRNTSFCYEVNMLRSLLAMRLITQEEFERIVPFCAAHYKAETICCV